MTDPMPADEDLARLLAEPAGSLGVDDDLRELAGVEAPEPDTPDDHDPSPLDDVEYTQDLEHDQAAELTALQAAFRDRAKAYKRQRRLVEDSEFWVAVCFRSRADKERFLAEHGLLDLGDKYLNGYAVDEVLRAGRDVI